jgi:hypothetical protein
MFDMLDLGFSERWPWSTLSSGIKRRVVRWKSTYCHVFMGDYRRGMDSIIGFIDHLHTPLGNKGNYSAIANEHTLQVITAPVRSFPVYCVFNSRFLATASNSRDSSASHAQVLFPQPPVQNSCQFSQSQLPYRLQLQDRRISQTRNQHEGRLSPDYTALYPRRQNSSIFGIFPIVFNSYFCFPKIRGRSDARPAFPCLFVLHCLSRNKLCLCLIN